MDPTERTRLAARVSQLSSLAFLATLAALHLLEPEFDPSWRMVSEYSLGAYGWVMRGAFLGWSLAVLSGLAALGPRLLRARAYGVCGWMAVLALALVGAAAWNTNPLLDQTPYFSHRMHQLCGSTVILSFPFLATACARALRRATPSEPAPLRWSTLGTWLGLLAFFGTIAVCRARHPGLGRVGPHVLMGWPNRLLVMLYHLWLLSAARYAAR